MLCDANGLNDRIWCAWATLLSGAADAVLDEFSRRCFGLLTLLYMYNCVVVQESNLRKESNS